MKNPSNCPNCGSPIHLMKHPASALEDFWQQLAEWSQATFGPDKVRGPTGPLKHLAKEVKECLDNPTDRSEYADLLFLVFDSARRAGMTYDTLVEEVFRKMEINRRRKWGPPSLDGPVEHVR